MEVEAVWRGPSEASEPPLSFLPSLQAPGHPGLLPFPTLVRSKDRPNWPYIEELMFKLFWLPIWDTQFETGQPKIGSTSFL